MLVRVSKLQTNIAIAKFFHWTCFEFATFYDTKYVFITSTKEVMFLSTSEFVIIYMIVINLMQKITGWICVDISTGLNLQPVIQP